MDAEGTCLFDSLPFAMRDSFLQEAFKLLDQHHRLKVVPLVCHLWRQLVPSTCSSLDVEVRDHVAAKGLASWLERYHIPLESIDLDFDSYWSSMVAEGNKLLEVVCGIVSLRSLKIDALNASDGNFHLPSLTQLTSLTMLSLSLDGRHGTACTSLVLPTQLRHLELSAWWCKDDDYAWLGDVVGTLVHLTSLDLDLSGGGPLNPQHLLPLTALRGLVDMGFTDTPLQAAGISVLHQLPITNVELCADPGDVLDMCSWVRKGGGTLRTLHLMGDADESLEELELFLSDLRTFAPQLRQLDLGCMRQLGHSTGLAGLTQLDWLDVIMDCNDAGMHSLQALTGLEDLKMDTRQRTGAAGWPFESLASSLQQLTFLGLPDDVYDDYDDMALAHEAAKRAFGSRVVESDSESLTLKPGVPAWEWGGEEGGGALLYVVLSSRELRKVAVALPLLSTVRALSGPTSHECVHVPFSLWLFVQEMDNREACNCIVHQGAVNFWNF
jgi:hypothetical protein